MEINKYELERILEALADGAKWQISNLSLHKVKSTPHRRCQDTARKYTELQEKLKHRAAIEVTENEGNSI